MREMADTNERAASAQGKSGLSRRQFLAGIGGLGVGEAKRKRKKDQAPFL